MWGPLLARSLSGLCGEGAPPFLRLTSGRATGAALWLVQTTAQHRDRLENIAGKDRAGRTEKVAVTDIHTASESESCSVMSDSLQPHGLYRILQARILDWVAFSFSRGSSQPRDQTQVYHIAGRFFLPAEPPGKPKNTGVSSLSLLQQIFLTQGLNQGSALQADSLPTELSGKPVYTHYHVGNS